MVERARYEALVRPLREAAFNLACWIVGDRDDAEDVVQEAFVRAFRAFDGFKGSAMKPWLLAIVRHEAYRALHQRRRRQSVLLLDGDLDLRDASGRDGAAAPETSPESQIIAVAEREEVLAVLARLPPIYREVIVLRDMEELSYAEIAEVAGIAIGTVMSRLHRGRTALRAELRSRVSKVSRDAM